eukprot:SAG31_NODE_941_length_10868_cov_9.232241_5_plen_442_part_00
MPPELALPGSSAEHPVLSSFSNDDADQLALAGGLECQDRGEEPVGASQLERLPTADITPISADDEPDGQINPKSLSDAERSSANDGARQGAAAALADKYAPRKLALARQLQLRKQKLREFSDRAAGCFASEASVDVAVGKWQLWLITVGMLAHLLACVRPWVLATAVYNAPYDGAHATLEVHLWLWFGGDFQLYQQLTDSKPNHTMPENLEDIANDTVMEQIGSWMPEDAAPRLRHTASGPQILVVDEMVTWGGGVHLEAGMNPGIAETFGLRGDYYLPEPSSALQAGRFFMLICITLGGASAKMLMQQRLVHRKSAQHARYRSQPLTPSPWLVRATRGALGALAFSSWISSTLSYNTLRSEVTHSATRICSMFEASHCGATSKLGLGSYAASLGSLVLLAAALLSWFGSVSLPETNRISASVGDYVKLSKSGRSLLDIQP